MCITDILTPASVIYNEIIYEINGIGSSFITLKDHKENLLNRPTTRLLNPAKNEIGRISKHILQNINKTLSEETKVNGCKNTESVINWFKSIPNKHLYTFLMFDIKDFYPSIKEKLLWEAIRFAKLYISITNKDIEAIFHARKSLLYYNDEPWLKNGEGDHRNQKAIFQPFWEKTGVFPAFCG